MGLAIVEKEKLLTTVNAIVDNFQYSPTLKIKMLQDIIQDLNTRLNPHVLKELADEINHINNMIKKLNEQNKLSNKSIQ